MSMSTLLLNNIDMGIWYKVKGSCFEAISNVKLQTAFLRNINWRNVKKNNVVNNVDM